MAGTQGAALIRHEELSREEYLSMQMFTRVVACLGIAVGGGLVVASARAVCPSTNAALDHGCSLATLDGFYVFGAIGSKSGARGATAGYEVYNGDGTMYGVSTDSEEGVISRTEFTGVYTLGADCSGTLTTTDNRTGDMLRYDQFVRPDGKQFTWINIDTGYVIAGFENGSH